MVRQRVFSILILCGALVPPDASADGGNFAAATSQMEGQFERLDLNHDQSLSLEEFSRRADAEAVLKRDFELYDFDSSQFLTRSEFAAVSGVMEPSLRGKVPDPMDDLVAQAVAALDESYDRWNERPGELVNAHTFVANFIGSISPGGKRYVTGRILRQADRDADGRLSRAEAKSFLQQQLGIRLHSGLLLREPGGRLVRFNRFLDMDRDRSDGLSLQEFTTGRDDEESAVQEVSANDRDGSGSITDLEFADPRGDNFFDPIEWFRAADVNLDARVDANELAAATDDSRQHLVASTLSAFDDDHDDKLSLREYRLSMHANVNYPWERQPVDSDRDGRLSYDEFVFCDLDLFQLQRRYYFHRLDRDGDGWLSLPEFDFRTQKPFSIHLRSIHRADSRQIYQNDQFPQCGWPAVSPDGTQILFHRCPPEGCSEARIVVMNLQGQNVRELCDGVQPSWSADGKQFACARAAEREGVWVMSADGRSGERIADGTAPKWSPDGERIAYLHDNGVWVYDVGRGETRQIYRRQDHRYQDLGDDIAWSPRGDRVAILGNLGETSDLLLLPVGRKQGANAGPARVRCSLETMCRGNLNWTAADGIIFAVRDAALPATQLVSVKADDQLPPRKMDRFESGHPWKSACVTPDQNWYIAVTEN